MFWFVMVVIMLLVIGGSVLVGMSLKGSKNHKLKREEMMALKASGAFPHRKENMP